MKLRPHRRNVVVWSGSVAPAHSGAFRGRRPRPLWRRGHRPRPMCQRCIRTGILLSVLGLIRLARAIRTRWWPPLTGVVLTVSGVMLRGGPGTMLLMPGFVFLLAAGYLPTLDRYSDGVTN